MPHPVLKHSFVLALPVSLYAVYTIQFESSFHPVTCNSIQMHNHVTMQATHCCTSKGKLSRVGARKRLLQVNLSSFVSSSCDSFDMLYSLGLLLWSIVKTKSHEHITAFIHLGVM